MRRALVAALVATLALSGCSGSAEEPDTAATPAQTAAESPSESPDESPDESPSESPEDQADVEITISGDTIKPNGKRMTASVGEPVILAISSDRAAELHVHSTPEQVVDVKKGKSTVELTVEAPGIVDVEEHDTGLVILQLEVR